MTALSRAECENCVARVLPEFSEFGLVPYRPASLMHLQKGLLPVSPISAWTMRFLDKFDGVYGVLTSALLFRYCVHRRVANLLVWDFSAHLCGIMRNLVK